MILIADSGSTKCDWVLLDTQGEIIFKAQTKGLNPNVLTTQKMHKRLAQSEELAHVNDEVEQIYFYGSGCGTERNKTRLKRFLEKYFRRASCEVHEDLMAACLSVTHVPGVVCILGTGSNACYYDGEKSNTKITSMGYMLMDEASGNYFGKKLLLDYYYKTMPKEIASKFENEYDLSPENVKENLYKKQNPNAYLSNFARFLFSYETRPAYIQETLTEGIERFIDRWVMPFEEAQTAPIHFVGSVALYAQESIREVLNRKGLTLGNIQQHPINGLTQYYQTKFKAQSVEG